RREQVVEGEAELLDEVAQLGVALVDELAAVLGDLTAPARAVAEAASAHARRVRFVDLRVVARLLQPVGAREAREAGADDGDPRPRGAVRRLGEPADRRGRRRGRADRAGADE